SGTGCSSGTARGTACVVLDPQSNINGGDHILVACSTDPGWVFLMLSAKGIISEKGSVLSHTAIIGRELGIPTIVGVKDATKLIPDGAHLSINGSTGEIQWESMPSLSARG
ncbi:MAG: PEP-utilizing enzyme, partial [Deltaproteobacteria bacterium]|nr:PEP-utilizing enzyme [Deltaproteobacteria bacterium]